MARRKRIILEGPAAEAVEQLARAGNMTPAEVIRRALRREDSAQREQQVNDLAERVKTETAQAGDKGAATDPYLLNQYLAVLPNTPTLHDQATLTDQLSQQIRAWRASNVSENEIRHRALTTISERTTNWENYAVSSGAILAAAFKLADERAGAQEFPRTEGEQP